MAEASVESSSAHTMVDSSAPVLSTAGAVVAQQENTPRTTAAEGMDDIEKVVAAPGATVDWDNDPRNALNWSSGKKALLVVMISLTAFVASAGTSIISPAQRALREDFNVSQTVALLPLSLYVFALGFGPVVGGPLSETIGRMPIYYIGFPLGSLFTLGAALTHNFGALCFLRFMAGFCWAPSLSVAPGSIAETFQPKTRGPIMAIYILMPFLGPGFGPVLGAVAVSRQTWRWTQYVLLFFAVACLILIAFTQETFPKIIKRRIAKRNGDALPPQPPVLQRIRHFAVVGLVRPVHMLVAEPIITFTCLYVAINFGVLFSFFAAVPYTFSTVYHFSTLQSGLVFLSVAVGCLLGLVTILACDVLLYRRQLARYTPPLRIPPEYRLYPAMIGCFGLPVGLFWYGWTSKASVSWVSPVLAIVPFAWGNLCVFVSTSQYTTDAYHGSIVASSASANSLARYAFAGAFPLFTLQMYKSMGVDWAMTLFGFLMTACLPIPWVMFKFGPRIRAKSKYDTARYE